MFKQFNVHVALERGIGDLGFTTPTAIQCAAIPAIMTARDVMASAMTGTGKTAAFLIPIIDRLMQRTGAAATRVLILAPTRELAAQIDGDFRGLAAQTKLRSAVVVGGTAMGPQRHAFERDVDVLVATPGRLLDHLQYPYGRLPNIEVVVLDEADRMLDMGFLPSIRRILARLPKRRQTLLFSATLPAPIVALARELLTDPIRIDVERPAVPASAVTQAVYSVAQEQKAALLVALLEREPIKNALVFTRTKHRADRLVRHLLRSRITAAVIHGDRSQVQRTRALAGFKAGNFPGPRRDGHCRTWHRHRGAQPRHQFRRTGGRGGLRAPDRAHGTGAGDGRRADVQLPGRKRDSPGHRTRDRQAVAAEAASRSGCRDGPPPGAERGARGSDSESGVARLVDNDSTSGC